MLSPQLFCIIASLFPLLKSTFVEAKGGELASLVETPFTTNVSHRQDFCARFQAVIDSNGTLDFKNALSGMKLHPVIQYGGGFPYFNYDKETGIDPDNPGLVAEMLDFIAEKANFTWRDSFGVYTGDDKGENKTWTQMLKWTTDTYDISIDKWAQSTDRLNMGVSFCDPWFDGSLIMVDRIEPPTEKNKPNFGNWLLPFENEVWWLTVGTIFFSCFVYQFLELLAGERDGRSFRKWFMDNFYLSIINFTQNYSYEPTSLAGRIFGVSFAFWTMLMGATYTANLASLLVERERSPYKISSITEAIDRQMLMCSHDKSFSDLFIDAEFGQQAKRFPRPNPIDMYQSLNNGECDILIGTKHRFVLGCHHHIR